MAQRNFDLIAPYYDALANVIFGRSISNSQKDFLNALPTAGRILVLGGGTGRFLPLLRQHTAASVDFIDASSEMLKLAKKRKVEDVVFIHGTEKLIPDYRYDAVITFYYLDLFDSEQLSLVIRKILSHIRPNGIWLAADFVNQQKTWQLYLLKFMYFAFRIISGVKARVLPDWRNAIRRQGLKPRGSKHYIGGFIEVTIWRMPASYFESQRATVIF